MKIDPHQTIERQVARYMADVAEAISKVKCMCSYGEFYVSEVKIGFDGEDTGYRIIPNEHGDYDLLAIKPEGAS